MTANCIHSPKI